MESASNASSSLLSGNPRSSIQKKKKRLLLRNRFRFPSRLDPSFSLKKLRGILPWHSVQSTSASQTQHPLTLHFRFFPCFDNNRTECLPAYAPNALISIAANTLTSRSAQQQIVLKTRLDRPNPVPFEPWINLPSRNFFRNATSIHQRMETLKTAADPAQLAEWWEKAVPRTEHPLTEASKWCFECWVLDSEGGHVRLCLMIQGQFRELPSGTYRSFSRTFILVEATEGSP